MNDFIIKVSILPYYTLHNRICKLKICFSCDDAAFHKVNSVSYNRQLHAVEVGHHSEICTLLYFHLTFRIWIIQWLEDRWRAVDLLYLSLSHRP